jgi:hypothetical protein
LPAFTDAAFTTVRMARIVLPWRPIRPRDLDAIRLVHERAGEDEQEVL